MQYFHISRFRSPSSPILCFPIFLLFFCVSGATAQDACFVFEEGSGNTVVTGLTDMGMAATELTLPASVTTVRSGAFDGGRVVTLTLDGCNPVFGSDVLAGVKSTLTSVNAGNGMTAANLHTMLATLGPRDTRDRLEEVLIGGISDAATATIKWTDMDAVLTSDVHVIMPAAQVRDQVFGDAEVYGRFTVSGELATFCGHASFEDDDNANMLFYVPTEFREDNRRVYIQRVHKVLAGQGVDTLHVFVTHLPSRAGGQDGDRKRRLAAETLWGAVDSLCAASVGRGEAAPPKVVVMGDFNAGRRDRVFRHSPLLLTDDRRDKGTYYFRGQWEWLDHILVSSSVTTQGSSQVVRLPWLLEKTKNGEDMPRRIFRGPSYHGGVSDHLPVVLDLWF